MPSQAKVKAVLSGDTVVLVSLNNPNEEKTLSLAYVSAPRLRREGDEVKFPLSSYLRSKGMISFYSLLPINLGNIYARLP